MTGTRRTDGKVALILFTVTSALDIHILSVSRISRQFKQISKIDRLQGGLIVASAGMSLVFMYVSPVTDSIDVIVSTDLTSTGMTESRLRDFSASDSAVYFLADNDSIYIKPIAVEYANV
jgi:hypothetical protein